MLSNSFAHIMSHPGLVQTTGLLIQTLGHGMVPIIFWGTHSCQGQFIALIQMGDPMLLTVNPWRPRVQKCHELTTVQVAPRPLCPMIVKRHFRSAFGTRPSEFLGMGSPNVHSLVDHIKFHSFYLPRGLKTQQITIKFGILHSSSPPGAILI